MITLKKTFQLWIRSSISLTAVLKNIRISKKIIYLWHHQQDFNLDAEWIFFATSHGKLPCNGSGGFVKGYVAKRSLQRPIHDQIFSYQSVLDLSVRKISSTTFFSVSHEETANVHADLEHCFVKSKIMSWTKSSHHFVPISCNKITHKLTIKDREFLQFDFGKSLTREIDIKNIKCFVYQLYLWYILEGWHSDWRWLYMNVHEDGLKIEFLHFFFHLLLVNVLSQCQIFYASSQFQQ